LGWFWYLRGYLSEARNWIEGILALTEDLGDTLYRARAMYAAGGHAYALAEYARARQRLGGAMDIFREHGHKRGMAKTLMFLSVVEAAQGEYQAALSRAQECVQLAVEAGDDWTRAFGLRLVGEARTMMGEWKDAHVVFDEARALLRKVK